MEAQAEHRCVKCYNAIYGVATLLGSALVVATLVWTLHYQHGFGWTDPTIQFNWHPMLMVFGMIFLYGQSILAYRTGRSALKTTLKRWHMFINLLAFICAVIALTAVFGSHNRSNPPKPNLFSLHSWIGLSTVILFGYQFVSGFVLFMYPTWAKAIRAAYMPVHRNLGAAIFVCAIAAALLGFSEIAIWNVGGSYFSYAFEGILINLIGVVLLIFGALVLYLVSESAYKRTNVAEDETGFVDSIN